MKKHIQDATLYSSPFSKGYWQSAAREIHNPKMLVIAAMFVALRVAVKGIGRIALGGGLYFSIDFFVNALGSMIYGPIVAIVAAAVSDTIGAILFPAGTYFLPFMFVEIAGSVIFALFLYRAKLSASRIVLSRFFVVLVCNFLLNSLFIKWSYDFFELGKSYAFITVPRLAKNAALFPLEAILLILWLGVFTSVTSRMGLTYYRYQKEKITWKLILLLVLLTLVGVGIVLLYVYLKTNELFPWL